MTSIHDPYQMNNVNVGTLITCWLLAMNLWVFLLFGIDKFWARRAPLRRISEFTLLLLSALGGWPGALVGMICFRHKTAKPSFLLKFSGALIVFVLLMGSVLKIAGKI